MAENSVTVGPVTVGNHLPFALIAGPCQIESRAHAIEVADALVAMTRAREIPLIYKSSFDKANRTSLAAARGVGMAGYSTISGSTPSGESAENRSPARSS